MLVLDRGDLPVRRQEMHIVDLWDRARVESPVDCINGFLLNDGLVAR
jgi:hypothetical protein